MPLPLQNIINQFSCYRNSASGSSLKETRTVSPNPSESKPDLLPIYASVLTVPASVTPKWRGSVVSLIHSVNEQTDSFGHQQCIGGFHRITIS
jgi:hypothetical protein